jgi:hypothetical protein
VRRGIGAARIVRRQARQSPHPSAVPGRRGRLSVAHRSEQRRNILRGAADHSAWRRLFRGLGTPKNGGTRLFCLSGNINKPGVYELPMGFNLMRMINEVGGGMRNGKKLKAVIPGGSSCPC